MTLLDCIVFPNDWISSLDSMAMLSLLIFGRLGLVSMCFPFFGPSGMLCIPSYMYQMKLEIFPLRLYKKKILEMYLSLRKAEVLISLLLPVQTALELHSSRTSSTFCDGDYVTKPVGMVSRAAKNSR